MAKSRKNLVISKKNNKSSSKKKAIHSPKTKKNAPLVKVKSWSDNMVTRCSTCDTPYEEICPGRTQPLCICHLICDDCGGRIVHHSFGEDIKFPNVAGNWCSKCGPLGGLK